MCKCSIKGLNKGFINVARVVIQVYTGMGDAVRAVDDVSMSMRSGQITVILGHNGAGKTSLISMIVGENTLYPYPSTMSVLYAVLVLWCGVPISCLLPVAAVLVLWCGVPVFCLLLVVAVLVLWCGVQVSCLLPVARC